MTQAQILAIFAELNTQFGANLYVEDVWLDMEEIAHIILESDESLYPDDRAQFKFDSVTQLLYMQEGYWNNGTFKVVRISSVTTYENILGLMLDKPTSRKAPYRASASV